DEPWIRVSGFGFRISDRRLSGIAGLPDRERHGKPANALPPHPNFSPKGRDSLFPRILSLRHFGESEMRNLQIRNPWLSDLRFGLAQAGDSVARLPLAALLEDFDALKPLEHVPLCAGGAGGAQAAML